MLILFRRLAEALDGPVLAGWCAVWPVTLTWSCVHGYPGPALLAIVALVLTPYVVRYRARCAWLEECASHERCHVKVDRAFELLSAQHGFYLHETAAGELEILADTLRGAPPATSVHPHALALQIEMRVAHLRKQAPDPPLLDLAELVAPDGDD